MPSSYNPYQSTPDFGQWLGDFNNERKMNQIMKQMGVDVPQGLMAQIINLVMGKDKAKPMVEGTGVGGIKAGGAAPIQPLGQQADLQRQQMLQQLAQALGLDLTKLF